MNQVSARLMAVQAPVIPVVGELISSHPGTISLGQGVVHYGPPPEVSAAVNEFQADPQNHKYKCVQGIDRLQQAIGRKLASDNRITVTADQRLVVTAGGNMAFVNALLTIADPGDEIILLVPYYFNHEMAVAIANCRLVTVSTDNEYQPKLEAIETAMTRRTRAVVTVSPNNPSGAVIDEATLREINALCRGRGVYHIHDEAYEYFTYGNAKHFSPGAIDGAVGHTISLFSLSKSYGFASWRIGYMLIPSFLELAVKKIQDTILICPPVISQFAAAAALEVGASYCRQHLATLDSVRTVVREHLDQLGPLCQVPQADGAFYFLLRLDTKMNPMQIVEQLVQEHGVAAIPGPTFGMPGCALRISYGALEEQQVIEGIGRFVRGIEVILGRHR